MSTQPKAFRVWLEHWAICLASGEGSLESAEMQMMFFISGLGWKVKLTESQKAIYVEEQRAARYLFIFHFN